MDAKIRTYNKLCIGRFVTFSICCSYIRYFLDIRIFGEMEFSIWCFFNRFGTDIDSNAVHVLSLTKIPGLHARIFSSFPRPQWAYIHICPRVYDFSHLTVGLGILATYMFLIIVYEKYISVEVHSQSSTRYICPH